ncbi:serine hydrolase domain-containing protein [Algoriphagus mannitolivorans]|uniref:serine hydrolase domain-containing protein n=1 Tax=Algoriphagus mannitolivorans TaxID=226504 RepID=UPI0003FD996B|nr:serine hydrolase domain-containing protein [Algoriphagus mannitolivorans]
MKSRTYHPLKSSLKAILLGLAIFTFACAEAQKPKSSSLYFPPVDSEEWEKKPLGELGWNQTELAEFLAWLSTQDTRALIILKDGKIVVEEYWGKKLTGLGDMDQASLWYWASAGKTLSSTMMGIAQQENLLSTADLTSKYLGEGWTAMSSSQEREIRLIHHLTFTTGIDDKVPNLDDRDPSSFKYLAKPGTRWSYHNGTYTILDKVLEKASGKSYQAFFEEKLGKRIGIKGFWQQTGDNNVFYSDARSFARFGLLLLSKGNWNGTQILDQKYFEKMTQSSQDINLSYGYLTWLNGKKSYMLPGIQATLPGSLIPSGPSDMFQALGKNGQFLMVVPSKNLVVIRMGGAPGDLPVPYLLARQMWDRLSKIIP